MIIYRENDLEKAYIISNKYVLSKYNLVIQKDDVNPTAQHVEPFCDMI
jgi:hypothetical protein